jgi:hypothetical protein
MLRRLPVSLKRHKVSWQAIQQSCIFTTCDGRSLASTDFLVCSECLKETQSLCQELCPELCQNPGQMEKFYSRCSPHRQLRYEILWAICRLRTANASKTEPEDAVAQVKKVKGQLQYLFQEVKLTDAHHNARIKLSRMRNDADIARGAQIKAAATSAAASVVATPLIDDDCTNLDVLFDCW